MKTSDVKPGSIFGRTVGGFWFFTALIAMVAEVSGQIPIVGEGEPGEVLNLGNELRFRPPSAPGDLALTGTFANGICTLLASGELAGPWGAVKNVFTTNTETAFTVPPGGSNSFYRAFARDLSGGRPGFTNLTLSYGLLSTLAGAGGIQDINNWRPEFEGAPATDVLLSGPHIAAADRAGGIYIADKDAHGVRKIRLDGTIITVAGTSLAGNGPDEATQGNQVALTEPNGLWVGGDGTVFILDLGNGKVRRLDTNGTLQTLFAVPGGLQIGRGLWVSDDETLAYLSSSTVVKKWTSSGGVTDFATGFLSLGNLAVDKAGNVLVTDRSGHRVYRLDAGGNRTVIAGNGLTVGGGDGQLAVNTALEEVRGVWCMPNGAILVATHRSSRVWYIDTDGYIHLFLNGNRNGAHAGDGTWFYDPLQARVSECRAVTMDPDGNILITENDIGYVRKVQFLPFDPSRP